MIGPVFALEMIRASRGRLFHYGRWAYGAWLAILLFSAASQFSKPDLSGGVASTLPAGEIARTAQRLVDWLIVQQTFALLLAAPSFAAGAVTDEKVKGTLEQLFLAHLWPGEIILGKLAARVTEGFLWGMVSWPVMAFVGVPGGVTPMFFAALAVVTLLMLCGVCAVSMLLSVWARTTREAVLAVYVILAAMIVAVLWAESSGAKTWWAYALAALDPLYILDAARDQPNLAELLKRLRAGGLGWLGITAVATTIAVWRLRPAYIKQQVSRPRRRWFATIAPRPPVSETEPVAWKEQFVTRGLPKVFVLALLGLLTALGVYALNAVAANLYDFQEMVLRAHWVVLALVALAVGVRASGCVTTERDRKTWESLVMTPLDFEVMLKEKTAGIIRATWPYYFAILIPGLIVASWYAGKPTFDRFLVVGVVVVGAWLVAFFACQFTKWPMIPIGWAVVATAAGFDTDNLAPVAAIGTALVYVLMVFMSGVGVWFSVRTRNTWLALLGTVLVGLLGASMLVVVSIPIMCLSCCFAWIAIALMQQSVGGGLAGSGFFVLIVSVGTVFAFYGAGRFLLSQAWLYLAKTERIPGGFVRSSEAMWPVVRGQ